MELTKEKWNDIFHKKSISNRTEAFHLRFDRNFGYITVRWDWKPRLETAGTFRSQEIARVRARRGLEPSASSVRHIGIISYWKFGCRKLYRLVQGAFSRFAFSKFCFEFKGNRAPAAQLVEHRAVMREVVSSTHAGPTLRVLK